MTNGVSNHKESDQEDEDASLETKEEEENGYSSLSHDAAVGHLDDVAVSGNRMEDDEAEVFGETKQANGFADFREMDVVVSDYREKTSERLNWKISNETSTVANLKTVSANYTVGEFLRLYCIEIQ